MSVDSVVSRSVSGWQQKLCPASARLPPRFARCAGTTLPTSVGTRHARPTVPNVVGQARAADSARRRQWWCQSLEDSRVESIVIEFDTPGGVVDSVSEFAAELRAAREMKPIVIALVNAMACSAGYWLAAQCTEILATPSGEVGSVGVYMCHTDYSTMNERIGIKPTYVGVPKYKAEGNSDTPLSDETRRFIQSQVERVYDLFIADIVRGRGRGLTADTARKTFGEGRVVNAQDAIGRKMIDRVVPHPSQAQGYATGYMKRRNARVQADVDYCETAIRIAERM